MDDDSSKVVKSAAPPNAGKGRVKGVPNKVTAALKGMIVQALENKGGVEYLEKQADENPGAFLTLVGKIIPTTHAGDPDNPITFADVTEDVERVSAMINDLARRSAQGLSLQ